jgi:hypothetical protein
MTIVWRTLLALLTTGVGVTAALLTGTVISRSVAIGLAIAYVPVLALIFLLNELREESHEEKVRIAQAQLKEAEKARQEAEEAKEALESENRCTNYGLIENTLSEICNALRDRVWESDAFNSALETLVNDATKENRSLTCEEIDSFLESTAHSEVNIAYKLLTRAMEQMCRIFATDTYAADRTKYALSIFKATIFEVREDEKGNVKLHRGPYYYPPGQSPKTEIIDPIERPRTAAALAFSNQETIVIEDIEKEMMKPKNQTRWEDLYTGQHLDYKSMVTTYIAKGDPHTAARQILGVLTIDTNREGYFREERQWQSVLANILRPFRLYCALLYELRRTQTLLLSATRRATSGQQRAPETQ